MPAQILNTQVYDNYDKALAKWLSSLLYLKGTEHQKTLLIVFATPERAFAEVRNKMRDQQSDAPSVIPLPFMSITRTGMTLDMYRHNVARLYREVEGTHKKTGKKLWMGMKWPLPVSIAYDVSLWGRNLMDLDNITEQIILRFDLHNVGWTFVDHPKPMGMQLIAMNQEGMSWNADVNADDKQRVMRRVHKISFDGWLMKDPIISTQIEKVDVKFYESHDLETVGSKIGEVVVP
jgi:hypothetical protein